VVSHPWFIGVEQEDIIQKNIVPPFIPKGKDLYGSTNPKDLAETIIPPEL